MMKKTIKEFLRPDRRKILLFVPISLVLVLLSNLQCLCGILCPEGLIYFNKSIYAFYCYCACVSKSTALILNSIFLVLPIILAYISSCLVSLGYDRFKRKK